MELNEFVAHVDRHLDPDSEESVLSMTPYLQALGSNRRFLGRYVAENIEKADFQARNHYSGATLILAKGNQYAVRVVGWTPVTESNGSEPLPPHVHKDGDTEQVAHTHPFALLTYGYRGPGYVTDVYDVIPDQLLERQVGDAITVGPARRSQLAEGSTIFFPAFRIAHVQHPPEAYSVSLNLMVVPRNPKGLEQYFVSPSRGVLAGVSGGASESAINIIELASRFPGAVPLLERVAATHALRTVRDHAAALLSQTLVHASASDVSESTSPTSA